jgi:hypothetical protein
MEVGYKKPNKIILKINREGKLGYDIFINGECCGTICEQNSSFNDLERILNDFISIKGYQLNPPSNNAKNIDLRAEKL